MRCGPRYRSLRCAGVSSPVVPFADVLGGSTWRGTGDGSCSQPATGRGHYVVHSSDTVAVRDVATSDVIGNDVPRHGTGGVSCSTCRWLVSGTTGDTGCQVHDGDGYVAPMDGSGWSRASAGLVLQRLYDLSVLFSRGSAPSWVVCNLLQPIRTVPGTSYVDYDAMTYYGIFLTCWEHALIM